VSGPFPFVHDGVAGAALHVTQSPVGFLHDDVAVHKNAADAGTRPGQGHAFRPGTAVGRDLSEPVLPKLVNNEST
jgi:hypothetical protein